MKLRIAKKVYKQYLRELPSLLWGVGPWKRKYRGITQYRARDVLAKHWERKQKVEAAQ